MIRENNQTYLAEDKKTFRFIQPVIEDGLGYEIQTEISFSPGPDLDLDTDISKLIARRLAEEFGAWLVQASPDDVEAARKHGLAGWAVGFEADAD